MTTGSPHQQAFEAAVGHHQAGRLAEAERLYRQILSQQPDHADAMQMLGVLAQQAGHFAAAEALLRKAIVLNPSAASYHANLGAALGRQGRTDEAIACHRRALEIQPDHPEALDNLAAALHELGRCEEAIQMLGRILSLRAESPEAYKNLGTALREFGRVDEAISIFDRALNIQPQDPTALWSRGFAQLLKGDFESGWPALEARWRMKKLDPTRGFAQPLWDGGELGGKRILLWAEQGLGDVIQFIRYAPIVASRGGRVIVQCQPELRRLLHGQCQIEQVVGMSDPPPPFDVHAPLMGLARIFRTNLHSIPADVPYLSPGPALRETWRARFGARPAKLKIGVVWAGSAAHRNDRRRSLALAELTALAEIRGIELHSLQKGDSAAQARAAPQGLELIDWPGELYDFADTAGLLAQLDLVISVDTAVAHLAGAMGKPVWVLLPFAPDWRWMLDRADSPWYPTMRLFRQPRPGDWKTPVGQIARSLEAEAAGTAAGLQSL